LLAGDRIEISLGGLNGVDPSRRDMITPIVTRPNTPPEGNANQARAPPNFSVTFRGNEVPLHLPSAGIAAMSGRRG
jgi:hypothetical protein